MKSKNNGDAFRIGEKTKRERKKEAHKQGKYDRK
jgi:hypothetical protein